MIAPLLRYSLDDDAIIIKNNITHTVNPHTMRFLLKDRSTPTYEHERVSLGADCSESHLGSMVYHALRPSCLSIIEQLGIFGDPHPNLGTLLIFEVPHLPHQIMK